MSNHLRVLVVELQSDDGTRLTKEGTEVEEDEVTFDRNEEPTIQSLKQKKAARSHHSRVL